VIPPEDLLEVMPRLQPERAAELLPHLNAAMVEFQVNRPARVAAFLAQLAHESNELLSWEELPHRRAFSWCRLCKQTGKGHEAGVQYEGRRDLGNTQPGDGRRYRGRGPIQLTGRANYRAAGQALQLPLEVQPGLAAKPEVGFRVAGWYWSTRKLNEMADHGWFDAITKAINGGMLGKAERDVYYRRALGVLGVSALEASIQTARDSARR
jgi:predicted chitinase